MTEEQENIKTDRRQQGIAYLLVMMTMVVMSLLFQQTYRESTLNTRLAHMSTDRISAEYNAKSGFNLGLFFFTISDAASLYMNQMTGSKDKPIDSIESYWNYMNSLPAIGSDLVAAVEKDKKSKDSFGLKGVMNKKNRDIMNLFRGGFTIRIADENGKINVNNCLSGQCKATVQSLISLFSSPPEQAFLESKEIDPIQLAYQIRDFINSSSNASPQSGVSDESAYYQEQSPSYKAKNRPLNNVTELKLVRGFKNDEVFEVFSPYLTTHPIPEASGNKPFLVNMNTAKPELIASLVPSSSGNNCREKFIKKMAQLEKNRQATAPDKKSLENFFNDSLCYSNATGPDKEDRKSWFTTNSHAFMFTITSNTNKMQTRLKVVIGRAGSEGQGAQSKSERSFRILSWRYD